MARTIARSPLLVVLALAACPGGGPTGTDGGATTGATTDAATGTTEPPTTDAPTTGDTTSETTGDTTGDATGSTDATGSASESSGGSPVCRPGAQQACYSGPDMTLGTGLCVAGQQTCDDDGAGWGPCLGEVTPQPEACDTPGDEDCDGASLDAEDGCVCEPGAAEACYAGPRGTAGIGACKAGTRVCDALGTGFEPCEGEVVPQAEDCVTPLDEDCDGAAAACTGAHLWSKRFGDASDQEGTDVAVVADGGVLVVGAFQGAIDLGGGALVSAGQRDAFVAKLDPAGAHLWSRRFGDAGAQQALAAATDGAGNVLVAGSMTGTVDFGGGNLASAGAEDLFVVKLDPAGAHLWSRRFGGAAQELARGVATDPSGGVFLVGEAASLVDFGGGPLPGGGGSDVVVAKLDPDGAHVWSKRFGDAANQAAVAAAAATDGSVIVTGTLAGTADFGGGPLLGAGQGDVFLARFDAAGAHVWSKRFGDANPQTSFDVACDAAGNVLLTGELSGAADFGGGALISAGSTDAFVAKFDPAGGHLWSKRFGDAAAQRGRGVAADPFGNVLVTGAIAGATDLGGGALVSAGQTDIFAAKFAPDGAHVWSARFGDAALQAGHAVAADGDANPVLTGSLAGTANFGGGPLASAGAQDVFVTKRAP